MLLRKFTLSALIVILTATRLFADWEPTKPSQTQTGSAAFNDTQENFAAINDGSATVAGTSGATFVFEGATADAFETTLSATDPTIDATITIPNPSVATSFVVSTLTTNSPDVANSVYGTSNNLTFEGATADAFETSITVTDPTADRTLTIPNTSVDLTATAPALTLGTSNSAGTATTVVRTDATILAFDATVPADGGTAAAGTATVAARRDHVHTASQWLFVETLTLSGSSISSSTLPTTSDQFMVVFDSVAVANATTVALTFNAASANYSYQTLATTTLASATAQSSIVFFTDAGGVGDMTGSFTFNRVLGAGATGHGVTFNVSSNVVGDTIALRGSWEDSATITTFTLTYNSSTVGKVHVYRLSKN